jgi:gentisate 1,2-dioxygenase
MNETTNAWAHAHVSPLWEDAGAHGGAKAEPKGHVWAWAEMQPLIQQALSIAATDIVERRVLSFRNPHRRTPAERGTIGNISAALQILKPGDVARPHRHAMNALRFVLQGEGASTLVNGRDCPMQEGDLITTPGWTWHEHVHHGAAPIVWLDALDVPLHTYLGTAAFEPGPPAAMPPTTADAVFRYPWAAAAAALRSADPSPDGATRVRYTNPVTGGPVMAMLDCFALALTGPTRPTRSSASAVFAVVEGKGRTRIGDAIHHWGPRDVVSLPANAWISHQSDDARLFMVTDRDVMRRLDLLKDEMT